MAFITAQISAIAIIPSRASIFLEAAGQRFTKFNAARLAPVETLEEKQNAN